MTPARRTAPRHRRSSDARALLDAATRAGSLVTITAVLVLGAATGALGSGPTWEPPTVRVTNAR